MNTVLLGLNYKTANLPLREKLHFPKEEWAVALKKLNNLPAIEGTVILSTCNRVELYAETEDAYKAVEALKWFLSDYHRIEEQAIASCLYKKMGKETAEHLFKVASSLDSLVVGENQILGQVKTAYDHARDGGFTRAQLNRLFQAAISVGKKVRTETAIGEGAVSVGSAAVDLVKEIFPKGYGFQVLLLGAGKVSELTARSLKQYGQVDLVVINRNFERARALATKVHGIAIRYEDRYKYIVSSDVIIVSTRSTDFVVEAEQLKETLFKSKMGKMYFFVDLSVPRNIDPLIQQIDNAVLYTLDDLQTIVKANVKKRETEINKSALIIKEGVEEYAKWYYRRQIVENLPKWREAYKKWGAERTMARLQKHGALHIKTAEKLEEIFAGEGGEEKIKKALKKLSHPRDLEAFFHSFAERQPAYLSYGKEIKPLSSGGKSIS